MKLPQIETKIKVDVNIAISISVTVILLFNVMQGQQTHTEVQQTKQVVDKQTKRTDTKLDIALNKTFDRLNQYGNLTALNDKQIIQIVKQILIEVR